MTQHATTLKNYGMNLNTQNITALKHMAVDRHTSLNKLVDGIISDWLARNTPVKDIGMSTHVHVTNFYKS